MKIRKIVSCLCLFIMCFAFVCCLNVDAADAIPSTLVTDMKDTSTAEAKDDHIGQIIDTIIGIIQFVGTGVAIIVITIYGIKYIIASPQDKADVKKQMVPIIIGCVLLFAAVNVATVIESFKTAIFS